MATVDLGTRVEFPEEILMGFVTRKPDERVGDLPLGVAVRR